MVSDNGPQYSSDEFANFTKEWDITHVTSSPHFPSSNGLAEKTVQTVKHLFDKAKASNRDPYIALLEYRNTPLECGYSPSQLLNSRRLRPILPCTDEQLQPQVVDREQVQIKLRDRQTRQKLYHNKSATQLLPLHIGEAVRIKDKYGLWQPAVVTRIHDPRSVIVETKSGGSYRRNSRHVIRTHETPFNTEFDDTEYADNCNTPNVNNDTYTANSRTSSPVKNFNPGSSSRNEPYITRSGRAVKQKVITSM